jgi:hypothetical protein
MSGSEFQVAIGNTPDHTVRDDEGNHDGDEAQGNPRSGAPEVSAAFMGAAKKVAQGDKKSRAGLQERAP